MRQQSIERWVDWGLLGNGLLLAVSSLKETNEHASSYTSMLKQLLQANFISPGRTPHTHNTRVLCGHDEGPSAHVGHHNLDQVQTPPPPHPPVKARAMLTTQKTWWSGNILLDTRKKLHESKCRSRSHLILFCALKITVLFISWAGGQCVYVVCVSSVPVLLTQLSSAVNLHLSVCLPACQPFPEFTPDKRLSDKQRCHIWYKLQAPTFTNNTSESRDCALSCIHIGEMKLLCGPVQTTWGQSGTPNPSPH